VAYRVRKLDTGAIQRDPLFVDPVVTLNTYYTDIHTHRDELLTSEVAWLESRQVDLVIVDATPLACIAGKLAGATVILLTNFTWDFIMRRHLTAPEVTDAQLPTSRDAHLPNLKEMVDQASRDYAEGVDLYLQLPGRCPIPTGLSPSKVQPAPLICRHSSVDKTRADILKPYGIADDESLHVLLIGFGGHDASMWSLQESFLPQGWVGLVLGGLSPSTSSSSSSPPPSAAAAAASQSSPRLISLPFDVYVPDLVRASDAVLGKVGYGFVSEALAHSTPIIYISREHWAEELHLTELVAEYNAGFEMSFKDFVSGNWERSLDRALEMNAKGWMLKPEDDAVGAAEKIVERINLERSRNI